MLEIKGIGTAAVLTFADETVLLSEGSSELLRGFDHVTIHADLMVHVRGSAGMRRLRPACRMEEFHADACHLLTAGSGSVDRPAQTGRMQKQWGGGAIFSFLEDESHARGTSQIVCDVWACGATFRDFGRLCFPALPGLRPARSHSEPWWGPVSAAWAFNRDPPACSFFFTFRVGEPEPHGRPFVASPRIDVVTATT